MRRPMLLALLTYHIEQTEHIIKDPSIITDANICLRVTGTVDCPQLDALRNNSLFR
jgi:hypothetical protein